MKENKYYQAIQNVAWGTEQEEGPFLFACILLPFGYIYILPTVIIDLIICSITRTMEEFLDYPKKNGFISRDTLGLATILNALYWIVFSMIYWCFTPTTNVSFYEIIECSAVVGVIILIIAIFAIIHHKIYD